MSILPTARATLPVLPVKLVTSEQSMEPKTVESIKHELGIESSFREEIISFAKELLFHAQRASHALISGGFNDAAHSIDQAGIEYDKLGAKCTENKIRTLHARNHGLVQSAASEFISVRCFQHFFLQGTLIPLDDIPTATDSEYLSGVIQFCQELCRYAVGRATIDDASSVLLCKDLVESIFEQLLEFDFRNGPLRRKYDSVKYAVKRLEDVLYELSLTGSYVADPDQVNKIAAHKRRKVGEVAKPAEISQTPDSELLNQADFEKIRLNMEAFDAKREDVIKRCRDVQKLSKQAIYGLHRGKTEQVDKQLSQAAEGATLIFTELIQDTPELRNGSYTNALEEYAEAALYRRWLEDGSICPIDHEIMNGLVNSKEYLGGLVDFTGEVGRYAVTAAAARDQETVRSSLSAMYAVQQFLFQLGDSAKSSLSKKESALKANIKKAEHLLYELSLVKKSGRNVTAAKTDTVTEEND